MSSVINAFVAATISQEGFGLFLSKVRDLDLLVITDGDYAAIEIRGMYDKLMFQYEKNPEAFISNAVAKSSLEFLQTHFNDGDKLYEALQSGKKKRNVGDAFKHIVSDNWKVDMVVTFNLRSLKNYLDLRTSGAAWFQIKWLAQAIKEATPIKYLRLIDRESKEL
jgi:thymidylate synthase (FAD)